MPKNHDFKLVAGPVGLIYTEQGKLFADCFGGAYKKNASEIARRWNIAPEFEQKNRELFNALEIIIANAVVAPDPRMGHATDCYLVSLGDIESAEKVLTTIRQSLTPRSGQ